MSERIVVDPITRIEGHLRIEAQMDGNRIAQAFSSGTMVRGIEVILRGRDPRDAWAFAQRICGVCTTVHAICSVRAVENALGITVPDNARLVRNLIEAAQSPADESWNNINALPSLELPSDDQHIIVTVHYYLPM